jgi:hypothetical protein
MRPGGMMPHIDVNSHPIAANTDDAHLTDVG